MSLSPVMLRGAPALQSAISFVRDQVACMRALHARYGRFVAIDTFWPLPVSTQRMFFAVGPEFSQPVLSAPQAWRPAGLTNPGPANSAQRRMRNNLVAMRGWQHTYYRKLLAEPLRRPNVEAMGARSASSSAPRSRLGPRDRPISGISRASWCAGLPSRFSSATIKSAALRSAT